MALFGNKEKMTKEEKKQKREEKYQQKYEKMVAKSNEKALDYLNSRGIHNLDDSSYIQVNRIANFLSGKDLELAGLDMMALGNALSLNGKNDKKEERLQIAYLQTLVEQNWILINQNQQILDELRKK